MKCVLSLLTSSLILFSTNTYAEIVAGAADLRFALDEIISNYKQEKNKVIKSNYGSSGVLYQQIRNSAPFSIYMSADEQYVNSLEKDGFTKQPGHLYAIGRIVLITTKKSNLRLEASQESLRDAILKSRKVAIANPHHAPYGKAAKEFFASLGLWELVKNKLVYGENISQATHFVLSGNADFGISALSLASAPTITNDSNYVLIPDSTHKPLRQKMVLLKNSGDTGRDFYDYIRSPKSKEILKKYGFVVPNQ